MTERPILFSGEMVRAILAGQKTQTRRIVKHHRLACLYGKPGDRLWVKETWATDFIHDDAKPVHIPQGAPLLFRADEGETGIAAFEWGRWRPSIFMRRWMSRITLELTAVRVERLQDISEEDAAAEGCTLSGVEVTAAEWMADAPTRSIAPGKCVIRPLALEYMRLWESINGAGSWAANPWVWVLTFKRVEASSK